MEYETEYYLDITGTYDLEDGNGVNKNVLLKIFDSNNCTISDTNIHCSAYGMYANAFQNGYVEVGYSYWNCYVSEKGNSLCSFGK